MCFALYVPAGWKQYVDSCCAQKDKMDFHQENGVEAEQRSLRSDKEIPLCLFPKRCAICEGFQVQSLFDKQKQANPLVALFKSFSRTPFCRKHERVIRVPAQVHTAMNSSEWNPCSNTTQSLVQLVKQLRKLLVQFANWQEKLQ